VFLWEGGNIVSGWRSKFIFLLIVYFSGFATAIYTLAPEPGKNSKPFALGSLLPSASQKGTSFNTGMHKCIDLGKVAAQHTGKLIKEKLNEMPKK
jgi:hypothetical protein